MSHEPSIILDSVIYGTGGHEIIRDLSLSCSPGEVLGILGPNGAGKSTLLDIISGLKTPSSGSVSILGKKYKDNACEIHSALGLVHERPILYEDLTASEHLQFAGSLFGVNPPALFSRIDSLISFFELQSFASRPISTYPKGIRQKVSLAAGIIHDPDILVLDEPTSSLDPRSARVIRMLGDDCRKRGKTVVLSTHILEIAESLCDRVFIMKAGQEIKSGAPGQLRADKSLEDVFLELTGGADYTELVRHLRQDSK